MISLSYSIFLSTVTSNYAVFLFHFLSFLILFLKFFPLLSLRQGQILFQTDKFSVADEQRIDYNHYEVIFMAGSTFGTAFSITTWGESHGEGVGVVIDGCPAGLPLSEDDIQAFLNRRKPGQSSYTTPRKEDDTAVILSGIFEGKTTGTPICVAVYNKSQRSKDYSAIKDIYRPGHADFTFDQKYGFRDYRGGGRSSGRETIGRVAAGAVAAKLLKQFGIELCTYTESIHHIRINDAHFDADEIMRNPVYMPDKEAAKKAAALLEQKMGEKDSVGGVIRGIIRHVPAGLGEPVFDKLDALLAQAMFSVGAVKGFEIGDGFNAAFAFGSENNDAFTTDASGNIAKLTNHAGGILGGMSDGSDITYRVAVKPTPSISRPQSTVSTNKTPVTAIRISIHDPIIVPRAVVVIESMAALTLADLLLRNTGARLDTLKKFYLPS